jgi:Lon protease-like protein
MSDDHAALAAFGGVARLFPLPNLVLFPQVVQGLHIFEPRYRRMTADALADDQLIALVLLRPGWEDAEDRPEVERVACLARIIHHEQLPDGRYNLRVRGIGRILIEEEVPADFPYRLARGAPMPDVVPAEIQRLKTLRKDLADAVLPRFEAGGSARQQLDDLFGGDTPLGPLCDTLAYALPIPVELKQQILAEPHVDTRAEILTHALRGVKSAEDRKFPPDFSKN